MELAVMSTETALLIASAAVGLGLLGLVISVLFPKEGPTLEEKLAVKAAATRVVAAAEPVPEDPLVANRRFFAVLSKALSVDETAPAGLAALHANLTADVFMERMQLAARSWRPDGFAIGARRLALRPDGAPPDEIAAKVLEGYEQLKAGKVDRSDEVRQRRRPVGARLGGLCLARPRTDRRRIWGCSGHHGGRESGLPVHGERGTGGKPTPLSNLGTVFCPAPDALICVHGLAHSTVWLAAAVEPCGKGSSGCGTAG
jgi:hypothetical protein